MSKNILKKIIDNNNSTEEEENNNKDDNKNNNIIQEIKESQFYKSLNGRIKKLEENKEQIKKNSNIQFEEKFNEMMNQSLELNKETEKIIVDCNKKIEELNEKINSYEKSKEFFKNYVNFALKENKNNKGGVIYKYLVVINFIITIFLLSAVFKK